MLPLCQVEEPNGVPNTTDIRMADFLKYRDLWLLYRSVGRYDSNGAWVRPISFLDAARIPKRMMDTFLDMDSFYEHVKRDQEKKKGGS